MVDDDAVCYLVRVWLKWQWLVVFILGYSCAAAARNVVQDQRAQHSRRDSRYSAQHSHDGKATPTYSHTHSLTHTHTYTHTHTHTHTLTHTHTITHTHTHTCSHTHTHTHTHLHVHVHVDMQPHPNVPNHIGQCMC